MRKIVLLIYCTLPILCYAQVQQYTPKVKLAIETYAFLRGQSAALKTIALQFPALKSDVAAAEKNSGIIFGRAERNIEHILVDELGNSGFIWLRNRTDSLLVEQLNIPIEKEQYAVDFLKKVTDKSSLHNTVLLKEIMSFAYHDTPHQEITDGHHKVFTTEGHPKAQQTIVKVPIPKSWCAEEAEMPETIQQFTSHCGKGNEKILIVVYDLPAQESDIILDEKSILKMIPPESKLIRADTMKIDDVPGMMIEVEETLYSATNKMKIRMLQFMFARNRKLFCLQGSIGPVEDHKNLDLHIKKYEPLFRLIASRTQIED